MAAGIKLGSVDISKLYLGSTELSAAYLGADKLYPTTSVKRIFTTKWISGVGSVIQSWNKNTKQLIATSPTVDISGKNKIYIHPTMNYIYSLSGTTVTQYDKNTLQIIKTATNIGGTAYDLMIDNDGALWITLVLYVSPYYNNKYIKMFPDTLVFGSAYQLTQGTSGRTPGPIFNSNDNLSFYYDPIGIGSSISSAHKVHKVTKYTTTYTTLTGNSFIYAYCMKNESPYLYVGRGSGYYNILRTQYEPATTASLTTPTTGGAFLDVLIDTNYIYGINNGSNNIFKYNKTTLSYIASSADLGYTSSFMALDENYIYVASYLTNNVKYYDKDTLSYVGEIANSATNGSSTTNFIVVEV